MALRLDEIEEPSFWPEDLIWPFPARQHFIGSHAFDVFKRELGRYVREEVPGRSFLIAGHRGAGKTALVNRGVDEVTSEVFRNFLELVNNQANGHTSAAGRFRLQRPLLVRIHGPSLLAKELPNPGGGENPKGAAQLRDRTAPTEDAHSALVQITIALYRALAAEFAAAYVVHARASDVEIPRGAMELAGQFTLELDNAPEPRVLRDFWHRLGRIELGLLWPSKFAVAQGPNGQGIREIVALATAAQAFQVCSGAVTYKKTERDSGTREQMFEAKVDASLKDVANRIFGLAAGTLVGVGVGASASPLAGVLSGLGAGLLSTLALTWSSKGSVRNERALDYSFIVDRSIQTLDRDLPLVIQRIRDAGLAPVFLVDELDKTENTEQAVRRLIDRLKHLTTDYGFFCFLTDRNYYEKLSLLLRDGAYPTEHTYFSQRLFVLYEPPDLVGYIRKVVRSEDPFPAPQSYPPPVSMEDHAIEVLARFVLHKSKLNMIDAIRELTRLVDSKGQLKLSSGQLMRPEYLLPAAVQMAIEFVLQEEEIALRVTADPLFAQLAHDALYLISRAWEERKPGIRVNDARLIFYLLHRQGKRKAVDLEKFETMEANSLRDVEVEKYQTVKKNDLEELSRTVGLSDLNKISEAVFKLIGLLLDFKELRAKVSGMISQFKVDGAQRSAEDLNRQEKLLEIIFENLQRFGMEQLLAPLDYSSERTIYPFIFDILGRKIGADKRERLREADSLVHFQLSLAGSLNQIGLALSSMPSLGMLPSGLPIDEIGVAANRLQQAIRIDQLYDNSESDLLLLRNFHAAFWQNSLGNAVLASFAQCLIRDASELRSAGETSHIGSGFVLNALANYIDLGAVSAARSLGEAEGYLFRAVKKPEQYRTISIHQSKEGNHSPLDAKLHAREIHDWIVALSSARASGSLQPRFDVPTMVDEAWGLWAERVLSYLNGGQSDVRPIKYEEAVLAVAGYKPLGLFPGDLARMTLLSWSELCVAAFPREGSRPVDAPLWVLLAGLRALGFGQEVLSAALREFANGSWHSVEDRGYAERFLSGVPQKYPGVIIIAERGLVPTLDTGGIPEVPVFACSEWKIGDFNHLAEWLTKRGAIVGGILDRRLSS